MQLKSFIRGLDMKNRMLLCWYLCRWFSPYTLCTHSSIGGMDWQERKRNKQKIQMKEVKRKHNASSQHAQLSYSQCLIVAHNRFMNVPEQERESSVHQCCCCVEWKLHTNYDFYKLSCRPYVYVRSVHTFWQIDDDIWHLSAFRTRNCLN